MHHFLSRYARYKEYLCVHSNNRKCCFVALQIGWHDLAFFDPTLYESLRKLLVDAEKADADDIFRVMDLTFSVQLRTEEGGVQVELVKNGKNVAVTPNNVYDYVRLYADQRMVVSARKVLQVRWVWSSSCSFC